VISNNLSELTITTIFLIFLAIKGKNIFISLAGWLYDMVMVLDDTWDIFNWLCRMTTSIMAFQTCTHPRYRKFYKGSTTRYCRRSPCHHPTTIRRHCMVACKSRCSKARLKLELCLTSLPVMINAKALSLGSIFPEGVDSFPIAPHIAFRARKQTFKEPSQR
jgi:hypothetical protein